MTENAFVFDVAGAEQFEQLVVQNSLHKPVLVDFWAQWCAPCKVLMPLLEKITASYAGELLLAKVDCDVEQEIVARLGVQSLPTVVLFKDGKPLDGFTGAQSEADIRSMLAKHVAEPAAVEEDPVLAAQSLFDNDEFAKAEALLKELLSGDDQQPAALLLYARCLLERGALADAEAVINSVTDEAHRHAVASVRAQLTFLRQAAELPDMADLKTRLAKDGNDDEALLQLSVQQLARQNYEPALDNLLQLFIRNRDFAEGAAHKALLQVFELLGTEHPLVTLYRRRLYQALY
ncbi:thioredoxin [Denitrificimonas caeni]|uniref:Thioredoxin n=1 Tax=Denitrificimonas caeni TaxID=521720 RepID=A0AAE9VR88_9GAMM|nr:thioredoxin [Denitrificimonas caeni]NLJ13267.1 thioredoxin [Gammaproteobacteria bacterium]WBE26012.1 thioredoxin [Denitrificimonas caeni]